MIRRRLDRRVLGDELDRVVEPASRIAARDRAFRFEALRVVQLRDAGYQQSLDAAYIIRIDLRFVFQHHVEIDKGVIALLKQRLHQMMRELFPRHDVARFRLPRNIQPVHGAIMNAFAYQASSFMFGKLSVTFGSLMKLMPSKFKPRPFTIIEMPAA